MPDQSLVDAAALTAALTGPGRLFQSVACVPATGSTNADLAAEAVAGAPSGAVLVADHQRAGRGRFERRWEAPPGTSVAVSVLLRPGDVPMERWLWLPLVTGVAVAEGLRSAAGVDAAVKWPNDVLIEGRKVCGILSERVGDAAVIGMGINTTLAADELPVPTATSLALEGSQASVTAVVGGVLLALEQGYRRWLDGDDLRAWFGRHCSTIGRPVRVQQSESLSVEGLALGVDEWGRLVVRTPLGERAFAAGDVLHLR
ncbi:biotin--[acetyl-CoA-carboxylase] ligase [Micropruina sp.]|uniref:biotin--[acetyl-CoA-carboxylase] ligase n=1 Tax=Micropruina sp. TaxID=2737536 RepID=UPI0039E30988